MLTCEYGSCSRQIAVVRPAAQSRVVVSARLSHLCASPVTIFSLLNCVLKAAVDNTDQPSGKVFVHQQQIQKKKTVKPQTAV